MPTGVEPAVESNVDSKVDPSLDPSPSPRDDTRTVRRLAWFAAVIITLLLVRAFVVEPARVRGDSMEPTLRAGAFIVVDKVTFMRRNPHRGDVVVTSDPRTGKPIVKRIVAIGGDSVGIDDGVLSVNGNKQTEPYIDNHEMAGFYFGPDVVPAGTVFVLGDNRADSVDSRAFGPVAIDSIDGRVLASLWPVG